MKTTTTVALMGITVAIAVGVIGINSTPDVDTEIPTLQSSGLSIMGHATFVVHDSEGNIKAYSQSDNAITDVGRDCAARFLFHNDTADTDGACNDDELVNGFDGFRYIGINNASSVEGVLTSTTAATLNTVEWYETEVNGTNWRATATPNFAAASGSTGAVVTIDSGSQSIGGDIGSTNITRSALFEDATQGTASANDAAAAIINIPNGVSVNDGDSLTVTWTVTVG